MARQNVTVTKNLKATPIPVVPTTMRITNPDGTVTRQGQLLLEQLQTAAAGGGGGGGPTGPTVPSPPVTIVPPAEVIPRSNGKVEVDISWTADPSADDANFVGVATYVEDPDISSGGSSPLAGTPLDGTSQLSGVWSPVFFNDSVKSPAAVLIDEQAGDRNVRIYLASFGPFSHPVLIRATEQNATPNIMVDIPGKQTGSGGMEYTWLVTNPTVTVLPDYDRPDPNYLLKFTYDPPDPATPIPQTLNAFAGCRIQYVPVDDSGKPQFPGTDSGLYIPIKWDQGYQTPTSTPAPAKASTFRCYFLSEDVVGNINSLVEGVTPYATATVLPADAAAPPVTNFVLTDLGYQTLLDGSIVEQASLSWDLPTNSPTGAAYRGIYLYLVNVTGGTPPLTKSPQALSGVLSNVATGYILPLPNAMGAAIPANAETWTIAAISVDADHSLADDPTTYSPTTGFPNGSPTQTWKVGPPTPGSPGSGQEYAPWVTVNPGALVTPTESTSSDGVRMVSFNVGTWTNPTDPKFGGVQVAMIENHDPTKPTLWSVPLGATSFQTPAIPAPGNFGVAMPINFYLLSDDPQGHKNSLQQGTTPRIPPYGQPDFSYTPTEGDIIPARTGWFSSEFSWPDGGSFQADQFAAGKIYVGSQLVVGGAPSSFNGPNGQNGQIAVKDGTGKLVAWLGESEPKLGQGQGPAGVYGGWFGNLYVGGTNPLDAPIFVDSNGIIQVGGIAAAQGTSKYPYISVRDSQGIEMGRIGASLNVNSNTPGDSVGPSPPNITAGAWFTQLAIGGNNISNWNILVGPYDPKQPASPPYNPGSYSQVSMRNVASFIIDYPAQSSGGGQLASNAYRLQFGQQIWVGTNIQGTSQWQFPGIEIYEVDNSGNAFGCTLLNRGMVLRGTQTQGYPVLASLVMYNGQGQGGPESSQPYFWGELDMYSYIGAGQSKPTSTVYLASGGSGNGASQFYLKDQLGNPTFVVDSYAGTITLGVRAQGRGGGPVDAVSYSVNSIEVIDGSGNWTGVPFAGIQTPWTSDIDGANHQLSHVSAMTAGNYWVTGAKHEFVDGVSQFFGAVYYAVDWSLATPVINSAGQFVGAGVQVAYGVGCTGVTASGPITCQTSLTCNGYAGVNSVFSAQGYYAGYYPSGPIVIDCSQLQFVGSGGVNTSGQVTCSGGFTQNGNGDIFWQRNNSGNLINCASNGIWTGSGVQTVSDIYSGQFGIVAGGTAGSPANFLGVTLNGAKTITVADAVTGIRYTFHVIGGILC